MNKKVLTETKLAYCDSTMPWSKADKLRNLHFRASKPVSVVDAIDIMTEALGAEKPNDAGYNNFTPMLFAHLPVGSKITLAREGSVCAYVQLPEGMTVTEKMARRMKVDECDVIGGETRLWWD